VRSAAFSHGSSPPRRDAEPHLLACPPKSPTATTETDQGNESRVKDGDRSKSKVRRGLDALLTPDPKPTPEELEEVSSYFHERAKSMYKKIDEDYVLF
jgi:hypothetical protein